MPDLSFTHLAAGAIVIVVVICAAAFFIHMRQNKRTPAQELAALRADPRAQNAGAEALADVGAIGAWIRNEMAALNGKVDRLLAPPSIEGLPPVGTQFFDKWDAILPFASQPNPITIDGDLIRSGIGAPISFKTLEPVAPSTQSKIVREA